jgi:hypothetical protein
MKGRLSYIIFVIVVVGLLLLYTVTSKKYPALPADSTHSEVMTQKACMECHGPGKKYAMKKMHPPKFDCPKCHKPAK